MTKVPVTLADERIQTIRTLAKTGKKVFLEYYYNPLDYGGWKRAPTKEGARKMLERIEQSAKDVAFLHTVAPHCKRLVSQAMNESLAMTGDAGIFFLEMMMKFTPVSTAIESLDFVRTIDPPLEKFQRLHQDESEEIFSKGLTTLSRDELKTAFAPVELGQHRIKVELQHDAKRLFGQIQIASKNKDYHKCMKLISTYLIRHGDEENNNREEVEKLIEAFQGRDINFRKDLSEMMSIALYYQIIQGITDANLKKTIRGIRKYVHIFQGNPEVKYFLEIDKLEQKLYNIITERDLWKELKRT